MQRNGQNPIKAELSGGKDGNAFRAAGAAPAQGGDKLLHCPSCQAAFPPKPGFRPSALKCPKCGKPLGKK